MEASAREYGLFYSFGANPDIFQRMQTFNTEIGERRFNSQVLIRPQGILTNFKAKTNPFRFTDTWANMERDGMIDWSTPDAEMHSLEALRTLSFRDQIIGECVEIMRSGDRRGAILEGLMGPMGQTYHCKTAILSRFVALSISLVLKSSRLQGWRTMSPILPTR